ncbi:ubiquinone/menaquinone biosynthesis C-methylase UbiE [Microbacterium sp. SLBN-154]|uniref:class I SAM-dependent methyltransferase n=1 Tax=Microbacterium sp. SLBN-154 TaxID=2768458 RepID=UPI0011541225|nr:class I SAM-dependent methyltransferase [Microbacterium sp. SLBN-154]TQK20547.1 ubiquinone/menaquinone biosynthesis C-methylase UbiE [Microbacterium sp. SLBN-154]
MLGAVTDATEAYSWRAAEYVDLLGSMDAVHAADRQLIDSWTGMVSGPVLDAGCGPGHWTKYLADSGVDVCGIDVVPDFIVHARSAFPGIRFSVGDIDKLQHPDDFFGGVLSWFSTIHHHPSRIVRPIAEFSRVLRPDGTLVLGFFDGAVIEEFDHAVMPAYRWPVSALQSILETHGFEIVETYRRTERGHRPVGAILCRRIA